LDQENVDPSDDDLPVEFGDYELLEEIGRGGQGVVYRARQKSLNRTIALKVISLGYLASKAHVKRFRREAEAAASLNHPSIVPIHEVGEREGSCYFSMNLIEGGQLDEVVKRVPMSIRRAVELIAKVARTVHYAHEHSILHRDIKPGNILVDQTGEPHLTDFGLARLVEAESTVTGTLELLGTPSYMAPEQARGNPQGAAVSSPPKAAKLTRAVDVYGLGAVLYQLLTGQPPFAGGTTYETIKLLLETEPRQPRLLNPKVDRDLSTICLKCLEKDPKRRYSSAFALAEDLEHWLKHETIQAKRSGVFTHTRKWVRRNPSTTVLVTLLVALAVGLSVTVWNRKPPVLIPKSVAVLPFENLSEDPNNAYFAEGMQEEILTRLAKIADLKVISRTSTQRYRSKPANLAEIAKQLGVANIVEGSVQKAADQVRVNVQLINAQTDSHLWADTYDRKLTDVLGVESEIAERIAESLQSKLTSGEEQALAVKPTNNPDAYDAYLRGLAFYGRSGASSYGYSGDIAKQGIGFYERAVQLDPNFAVAWAQLSRAESEVYFNGDGNTAARREVAKRALENAQKLEPDSPETLLALGYYQYRVLCEYGGAKSTFDRASRMLPSSSEVALALGRVLRREGHWDESVAYFEQALTLDPRNRELLMDAVWNYGMLRRFPTALKLVDRLLDIRPDDPEVMACKASLYQAQGTLQEAAKFVSAVNEQTTSGSTVGAKTNQLRLERRYSESIRLLQARLAHFHYGTAYDKAGNQIDLALIQRLAGDTAGAKATAEQARNTFEQLYRTEPNNAFVSAFLSQAYAVMGEKDLALRAAEQAMRNLPSAKDPVAGPSFEENMALIQAIFGETSRPIATLTRLLQTPFDSRFYPTANTSALLGLDPFWDPLRSDPAFQKLCEERIDKSIAVLPFENLSSDSNNAYFAEGIQEEILTRLAKIGDLKVISRTSTQRYKSKPDDIADIAKQLGVANILEGSVQKAGDQVRVNMQLINAQTDSHVWADTYDRKLTDILGVESEIAKRIAESLQAKLTSGEEQALAVKPTNNPKAYDEYLRGLAFEARNYFSSYSPDLEGKAAGFYERAVQLDPNFAIAWARLSRADARVYSNRNDPTRVTRGDAAKRALEHAQTLEPNSTETLLALGYYQFMVLLDSRAAKTTFGRVSEMLPSNSEVYKALGSVSRKDGYWDQSIAYYERAVALDPRNSELLIDAALTYVYLRRFPDALRLYERALDITPNDLNVIEAKAGSYQAEGNLKEAARLLQEKKGQAPYGSEVSITQLRLERNYGEAIRLLQEQLAQFHFDSKFEKAIAQLTLAGMQRVAGDIVGAKATAEQGRSTLEPFYRDQPDNWFFTEKLSDLYALMGDKESALKLAQRAIMLVPRTRDAVIGPGMEENLAVIEMFCGDKSHAISILTRLLHTPYDSRCYAIGPITSPLLKLDPFWDPLRVDPAFRKLCEEKIDKSIAVQKAATR
jgi:TolB-like protein/Flp pilus assembly protein TadD/predicted Ser/Thr protein kinase